jgi:Protein of unknown function (DUF1329)
MRVRATAAIAIALVLAGSAEAVTPEEGARLDGDLTPVGAERAGNADGSIPAWTGGLPRTAAIDPVVGYIDPFALDPILVTITAENSERYREQLTAGHLALLKLHPESFRMYVYPTRRTAAYPEEVLAEVRKQAPFTKAIGDQIVDVGKSAVPFPIPTDGVQVMWNHVFRWRGGSIARQYAWFPVARNGRYFKVRIRDAFAFDQQGYMAQSRPNRLYNTYGLYIDPPDFAGNLYLLWEPIDQALEGRVAWTLDPVTLRLRREARRAYDDLAPATDGLRTVDEYDGWNGSPDLYDWRLVGKREKYIAYNSYRLSNKQLKYKDILKPHTPAPALLRYELHRVWVVEATLKPGAVHRYPKRTFYLDEDTWQVAQEEVYDGDGNLWRFGDHQTMQFYDVLVPWYRATIHYDLKADAYLMSFLDNEERFAWRWGWQGQLEDFLPNNLQFLSNW